MINFIQRMLTSAELDLESLSRKLTMLLAFSNSSRPSDIRDLDLRYRYFTVESVTFRIPGLTKTRSSWVVSF